MCGIVGAMALGKLAERPEKLRQESMIFLTTELLQLTQARGTDATGVSILFNDGNFAGLKMGISSPEFISRFGGTKLDFEGFIRLWRDNEQSVKTYLGHCRKTSVGSAKDNSNNHPIKVGNIVGIHNGTLTNHDVIFSKLGCKRDGDVDSEAIMRMLHFYTKKGTDPFTIEMLEEVCMRLQGTYSVVAYNGDNPNQIVTFRDGKPAVAALLRPLNLLLIASEENYIKQVLFRYNKHAKIYLSRIKFPILKKDDINFKIMVDDTCAIFDLSNKVDKDTDVEDLFESKKVPRLNKIWKKGTTYGRNHSKKQTNHVAGDNSAADAVAKKNEEKAAVHKSGTEDKDKKDVKGKVWNKELKEFKEVDSTQKEKAKKIKSIEIDDVGEINHLEKDADQEKDTNTGEIVDVKEAQPAENGIMLEEVSKEKVNSLIGNTAKIKDEPVDYKEKDAASSSTKNVLQSSGVTVEVNTEVNPIAMEAATKAAAAQAKFENDDEVLEELGVDNKRKLESLQLFAFANRVSKMVFKSSFYKGFVKAQENGNSSGSKMARAEKSIKTLKTVTKIFMRALRDTSHNDNWKEEHIVKGSHKEGDLTIDAINRVFSIGDERDYPELKCLKDKCALKE